MPPSNPPTLADFDSELSDRIAREVGDVGLYLDGPDGTTKAFRAGLRVGLKAVAVGTASPLDVTDADVANLTTFASERVLDEAARFALRLVLQNWYRAARSADVDAIAKVDDTRGGWLYEHRQGVKEALAALDAACSKPYREPSSPLEVGDIIPGPGFPAGCQPPPGCYPAPAYFPWGYY